MDFVVFPFCKACILFSSCAVHAVSCFNANRCLGLRAIIHGARWCVVCVSFSVSGCTPSPLPPRGAGKTGRLSGDSPCVTTHSLLRLPTKHRHARRLTQVRHKFNACSTHCVFHVFPKVFHTLSGDVHLVFAAFDAIL